MARGRQPDEHAVDRDPAGDTLRILRGLECERSGCICHRSASHGKGATHCPVAGHRNGDRDPSLSIRVGTDQAIWTCHGPHTSEQVGERLREMGLWGSTVDGARSVHGAAKRVIATTDHQLRSMDGTLLALHHRVDYSDGSKSLSWRHPDGRPGLPEDIGTADLLYGLHNLAREPTHVVIVEGEKAADALQGALGDDVVVLGTVGAEVLPTDQILEQFQGRTVALWPDNDAPGRKQADQLGRRLTALGAARIRLVNWPAAPPKGDAADFLDFEDGNAARRLLREAPLWEPREEPESPAEPMIPWQTADEILADTPAEVDWAWRDYLALGTLNELDAKLKAGKTTFLGHLLQAFLTGQPFLGRETLTGPIIYLTEEGTRTFRGMLTRTGLAGPDMHVLSRRKVPTLEWQAVVDVARAKLLETGAMVLVVDTLGKLAGFQDDDKNSSGKAMTAMLPLQSLASDLNIVVIVVRHDRKAGGEIGDSARGSSAFGGDVDQILHLSRVGGRGREHRRHLRALGRFDETPAEITIELTDSGYQEISETDAVDAAAVALLAILPESQDDALFLGDETILAELREAGHTRTVVYAAAKQLVAEGKAAPTSGKGPKGHPRTLYFKTSSNGGT